MHILCSHFAQSCQAGCCDRYGQCPQYSQLGCHHFYSDKQVVPMMYNLGPETYWVGLVSVLLLAIGLIVYWCINRKKETAVVVQPYQVPSGIHPANIQYGGEPNRVMPTTMDAYSFKQTNTTVTGPVPNQYPSTMPANIPNNNIAPTTNLQQNMPARQTLPNQPMSGESFGPQTNVAKSTIVTTQQYTSAAPVQFASTMPTNTNPPVYKQ